MKIDSLLVFSMKYHEFTAILEAGEGISVEFKRKVTSPEKIAREIVALANTTGGILLFGVDDDRTVIGVRSEKEEMDYIRQAAEECSDPPVPYRTTIFNVQGRDVICMEIPESTRKPHYAVEPETGERKAFIRVGENSVQASREMVKIMEYRSGSAGPVRIMIGEAERRLFSYLETHDRITVKEYSELINVSKRRASRLLIRLVRAGVLAIHTMEKSDFFTLMHDTG
ncbi:MAG: ATP-binding protein [Bacteroidota bacterium]|nr:ATP-binding protein [Bacteroidota bacterium]